MSHLNTVQTWLADNNLDIAYISDWKNIQYFTGFGSDPFERTLALFIFPDKDPSSFHLHLRSKRSKKRAGNILSMAT